MTLMILTTLMMMTHLMRCAPMMHLELAWEQSDCSVPAPALLSQPFISPIMLTSPSTTTCPAGACQARCQGCCQARCQGTSKEGGVL